LTDGGGLLRTYRPELGIKEEIQVEAIDLMAQLQGLDESLVEFASAGGATHNGMGVAGALMYRAAMPPELIKARYDLGLQLKTMTLQQYLERPCLLIRGTKVSRRDLIRYVSNKKGGVHYDRKRSGSNDSAFLALDTFVERVRIADKEAIYFELLAIGQTVVRSAQLKALVAAPS
jgi:hypothetical protein